MQWDHLIYQTMLVVMVITGYHAYYRSQWEAHMRAVICKMMQEVERSSRKSNHTKSTDYHDDSSEYQYTRDSVVSFCSYDNSVSNSYKVY